ncbi:MAG: RIFT barrel domain-containing protein [Armatimonadota bacterium]
MPGQSIPLTVSVSSDGLRRYSFQGLGYQHNLPVADRRQGWPVSRGIPLPEGAVRDVEALLLRDAAGQPIPRQLRELCRWPDGSVKFVFVQWQADVAHDAPAQFTLELTGGEAAPRPETPVVITERDGAFEIDNGPLHAVIDRDDQERPTLTLRRHGRPIFSGVVELLSSDRGDYFHGTVGSMRVVEPGPVVGVIEISGRHIDTDGLTFLDFTLQLRFDAGRDELEMIHTFINMEDEPEGVQVGEISLRLPTMHQPLNHVVCQNASGQKSFQRLCAFPENPVVNLVSTGSRISDVDLLREDTSGYPSYLMNNRDVVFPWIGLQAADWSAMMTIVEGRENWPKTLAVVDGQVMYFLWPANSDLHNLGQGMARHHHLLLTFFPAGVNGAEFQRYFHQVDSPANVTVPFAWYQQSKVFGMHYVMPWLPTRYRRLEGAFLTTIERGWPQGMLGYGDDPNSGYDYSFWGLPKETVWINNEHDYISAATIQTWRSGRPAAWKSARLTAEHQIDVDFVRKSDDPWKAGGIPAHCARHTSASVYPSHTWTEGLAQYYCTSGDERALEVVHSLGRNVCKYVEEAPDVLDIESRMPGWALIALCGVVEVTGDERCLRAAQALRDRIGAVVEQTGTYDSQGMNYGTGTVLTGLANLHRITGDGRALQLLLAILDWHLEHGRNEMGIAWGRNELHPYKLNLTLPAYAYAYHATGNKKYLEEGLEFLRFTGMPDHAGDVRGGAKQYRTYMPFLLLAHEAGVLDEMERLP